MACPPQVPISILPPVSQGVSPILWQNGSQITRLNTPLNPSFLVYDGTSTRWGDGSSQSPIYLPNLQQVSNGSINYIVGSIASGAITKTGLGTNGQFLSTDGVGLVWVNSSTSTANNIVGGAAGKVVYQTGPSTTGFTAQGTTGQVLSSNGTSAPTWINQSALSVGSATNFSSSLSGDVTGTQSATSVVKVNGASIPTTKTIVGTNGSGQIIDASSSTATVALNTTGNAATSTSSSSAVSGSTLALTTAKAWVNFNGTISATGALSYTRIGTTVTVTQTATPVNVGDSLYIYNATDTGLNSGTALSTWAVVTSKATNSFTFTTTATGANGNLTYYRNPIRSSYNISSISKNGTGDYTVNFATAMADANYAVVHGGTASGNAMGRTIGTQATSGVQIGVRNSGSGVLTDDSAVHVAIFGN